MNCVIVDDDPIAQEVVLQLLKLEKSLEIKGVCNSAFEGIDFLKKTPVDLMILDIEMPGKNGIELLQELEERPVVIIISAKEKYAFQGYQYNVADYLLKPINPSRFSQAIQKAIHMRELKNGHVELKSSDFVFLKDKSILYKIAYSDILCLESSGDYVKVHTVNKVYLVHSTLKALESKLPRDFVRVHRSNIISIPHIDRIEENLVYVGKKAVPVSESHWNDLTSRLNIF